MMNIRAEHLAWCKTRALEVLGTGNVAGAIASMTSNLRKWREPLYDEFTLTMLTADGMLFCSTADQVRRWVEGFN